MGSSEPTGSTAIWILDAARWYNLGTSQVEGAFLKDIEPMRPVCLTAIKSIGKTGEVTTVCGKSGSNLPAHRAHLKQPLEREETPQ